jgi:hypothetical protein
MMIVLVRSSNERLISSMPKTIPASGVLNAAATPAAEPASMKPRWRCGASRPSANMIEAPICTVGPWRPLEAPQSRPSVNTTILPKAMRIETSERRNASS